MGCNHFNLVSGHEVVTEYGRHHIGLLYDGWDSSFDDEKVLLLSPNPNEASIRLVESLMGKVSCSLVQKGAGFSLPSSSISIVLIPEVFKHFMAPNSWRILQPSSRTRLRSLNGRYLRRMRTNLRLRTSGMSGKLYATSKMSSGNVNPCKTCVALNRC
jgi:hypothetical protein